MIFNCLTIFPEMFSGFMNASLLQKAIEKKIITVNTIDFRDYSDNKHRRVDDYPFGGGAGMLLMAQPIFDCFKDVQSKHSDEKQCNIYMSPSGYQLTQSKAKHLAAEYDVLNILCGHYEGVDQRVIDEHIDLELSIGDYVLSGGELPAMVLMDCVMRYVPEFMSNEESLESESFEQGLLEYPQYTRPQSFEGLTVPDVLLSGHHKNIKAWQREQALLKTARMRPDLLKKVSMSSAEEALVQKFLSMLDNTKKL